MRKKSLFVRTKHNTFKKKIEENEEEFMEKKLYLFIVFTFFLVFKLFYYVYIFITNTTKITNTQKRKTKPI